MKNSKSKKSNHLKKNQSNEEDIYDNLKPNKNEKVVRKKATNKKRTSNSKIKKIQSKKRKTTSGILRILALVIIIGTVCVFIAFSPLFNITAIEVINNEKMSAEKIQSVSGIKIGSNIFGVNSTDVKNNLKTYLENVNVKKSLPGKIIIDVKERVPKSLIEFADVYIQVDNQGYMIETLKEKNELPLLIGISTKIENIFVGGRLVKEDLEKLELVMKIIEISKNNEIYNLISKIDISNDNNYKLILESDKKVVYLGDCSNLHTRILYLASILEKQKGIEGEIFINGNLESDRVYFAPKI